MYKFYTYLYHHIVVLDSKHTPVNWEDLSFMWKWGLKSVQLSYVNFILH